MIFTDLGVVTTTRSNGPALTRTMLTELAAGKPDVHRVRARRRHARRLRRRGDPRVRRTSAPRSTGRGAVGQRSGRGLGRREAAARALRHRAVRGHRPGDRQPGGRRDHRASRCGVPAFNAITDGAALGDRVIEALGLGAPLPAGAMSAAFPAVVLGGTGYVAGELLRLLAGASAASSSRRCCRTASPGEPVAEAFPHLRVRLSGGALQLRRPRCERVAARDAARGALLGRAARRLGGADRRAARRPPSAPARSRASSTSRPTSATASGAAYEAVYEHAHGAPAAARASSPARVPEHLRAARDAAHVAHPGCFATAILLAACRCWRSGSSSRTLFVRGVTGSTGSGRKPMPGTHHPLRHSDLYPTTRSRIATRRSHRLRARRERASRRSSPSCRTPVRSRAAST